jgi:hypothetical protein
MQIATDLDLRPVAEVIRKFPEISKKGIRLPLLAWVGDIGRALAKRLSGREGNVGLNRRTGRTLAGNLIYGVENPNATKEDAPPSVGFQTFLGFMDAHAARIARVHELGTVGKGGTLPDITPKRFEFLWVPVTAMTKRYDAPLLAWADANGWIAGKKKTSYKSRNRLIRRDARFGDVVKTSTAKTRGGQEFILLRKASIPPRLGFRKIHEAAIRDDLPKVLAAIPATIAKLVVQASKTGGRR